MPFAHPAYKGVRVFRVLLSAMEGLEFGSLHTQLMLRLSKSVEDHDGQTY
jgi:hypothetical protein